MPAFLEPYVDMWKNYANFNGRTSVRGYWMAVLINVVVSFLLGFIGGLVDVLSFLSVIYSLAILIPGIALTIRRLHDTGRKGIFVLLSLIPLVGGIIVLVFCCQGSTGDNEWGPAPQA